MKFIKKHILNEGLFGTKAQMQAKLSREAELSDEEVIVSEARGMLERKVGKIISEIFKQNQEMFEVIDFSPYSYKESYSMGSVTANMSYFIRKELSVKIDKNGNQDVIHLTLDLGGFNIGVNKVIPATNICFPHLIPKQDSSSSTEYAARYKKQLLKDLDPVSVKRKFCNRLRRLINKVTPKKDEQSYYDFIAGSKIVLDEITMYTDVKIDKFIIRLEDAVALKEIKFLNPTKKNYDDREEIYFAYKPLIDALVNVITFGCPIAVTAEVRRVVDNGYIGTKDLLPMDKFAYPNFGSFESELGRNPYVTIGSIAAKYFKEVYGELPEYAIKELKEGFSKCNYFDISYSTHYSGKIVPGNGFVIDKDYGVFVDFLRVSDSETSTWNAKYVIFVRRENTDVDARRSPIKILLKVNSISPTTTGARMEELYEYGSIEHKCLSTLLDHSIKLITTQQ